VERAEQQPDLVKLSDSESLHLQEPWQDIHELDVYDINGEQIGSVEDLYVDQETLQPRFLDVGAGGFLGVGKKHFLIPVEVVKVEVSEERVSVDQERDKVVDSPEFDPDEVPEAALQRAVYAFYDQAGPDGPQVEGAAEEASETTETLTPRTYLLSETTNEAGQTVQRTIDESGNIIETTQDEAGNLVAEDIVGTVDDLPSEEEHSQQEGQTVRTVKEETGALIHLSIGPDGKILDLSLPPQKEEVVEEDVLEEHSESHSKTSQ